MQVSDTNKTQIELWNGRVGEKWAPLHLSLSAKLAGATCVIWLADGAEVTGVDVSGRHSLRMTVTS